MFLDGSTVKFRLNTTGPAGAGADGDWPLESATGISELSKNSNFSFQVSAEAYPLVALGLGTGLGFSWSNTYFSDVNGDGLVDFVTGGTVHFNTLDADGIPTFSTSSATTPIPLDPSPLPDLSSAELAELSATLDLQSPPIDTVRRFIAPFTGDVLIDADVALDGVGAGSTDGVRVAVQHNGTELDDETLVPGGPTSAFAAPIPLTVTAGDRIYFRAGAIDDGVSDSVDWQPVITYQSPSWPATDANGLSQVVFSAASDFTLAGRPRRLRGHAVHRHRPGRRVGRHLRTADRRVDGGRGQARPRRRRDADRPRHDPGRHRAGHVPVLDADPGGRGPGAGRAGSLAVQHPGRQAVRVRRRRLPGRPRRHRLLLDDHVRVDRQPDRQRGVRAPCPAARRDLPVRQPDDRSRADPTLTGTHNVLLSVKAPQKPDERRTVGAVITVKSADGFETKTTTTLTVLPDGTAVTPSPVSVDFSNTANKWVEVMIRDSAFSRDGLTLQKFVTVAGAVETPVPNAVLRWSGMQGIFPQPYRGWGIAGYTAGEGLRDVAMAESAFVIDPASFPTDDPTRDDVSLDEAHTEPSYAFIPAVAPGGGTTAEPVATDRWVGPRAVLYADATTISTSRLAVDSVDFSDVAAPPSGGGRSAPTRLGISGPGLTLSFGIGPLGASAGLSPSFGLTDFEDLNGDGYPDVISTGYGDLHRPGRLVPRLAVGAAGPR